VDVAGCGRLSAHDGSIDLAWFLVCKLGCSLAGEVNVSYVVVVGASAGALGDRRVCVEVVCFMCHQHA
jgi:hypothetical protein